LWGVLLLLMPSRKLLQRFFRWESQGNTPHQDWIQLMILGISTFRAGKEVIASVLSNAELRRIQQPVLLLLGGRSVVQHVEHCRRRAMRYLAHLQVTVLPGASHNISLDDPEAVNGLVLDFL
jgi:pimeloyl-ACP methyl ester carboxylesterase